MSRALRPSLQRVLRKAFGDSALTITRVDPMSGGFVSQSYCVTVRIAGKEQKAFVKKAGGDFLGLERQEDRLSGYLLSQRAMDETHARPRAIGCFRSQPRGFVENISPLSAEDDLWQVQEYQAGERYLARLLSRSRRHIEKEDRDEIHAIVEGLVRVHQTKTGIRNPVQRASLYRRALRDVLTHPEMTLMMFDQYLRKSRILRGSFRDAYLIEMIRVAEHFGRHDRRLALVHGDFWMSNILFDHKQRPFFIDYSRFVHGEPGMDVGEMYAAFVWLAFEHQNPYFQELARYFVDRYVRVSGDALVRRTAVTYIGFTGAAVEAFCQHVPLATRRKFLQHIFKCLQARRLVSFSL